VAYCPSSSWPGLSRPSTPYFLIPRKTWMPGTRPGMTEISCLRRKPCRWADPLKHEFSSRRADTPELLQELPPRGRGECRMPDAPAASCAHIGSEYAHEYSQRATGITRHPRTQWFTAYFVLSPATGFLATVVMRIKSTNLMPASGHQDHTTSPSASTRPRQKRRSRPPHPVSRS
jgi:hypothetical protein